MISRELENLVVGQRMPPIVDLADQQRRWIWLARLAAPRSEAEVGAIEDELAVWCSAQLHRLYDATYGEPAVTRALPTITLSSLDEVRVVVDIVFAGVGREVEHSFMVSTYGVLRRMVETAGVDELEGLPTRCFGFLTSEYPLGPRLDL